MLKMRLQRIGRRNDAAYRLIVTDSRRGPKSGKHIDLLGSYNPKLDHFSVDGEKAREWIGKGVQVSDTVHNLLISKKIIEGKKINVLPRKSPIIDEEAIKAAEAAAKAKLEVAPAPEGKEDAAPKDTTEASSSEAEEDKKTE